MGYWRFHIPLKQRAATSRERLRSGFFGVHFRFAEVRSTSEQGGQSREESKQNVTEDNRQQDVSGKQEDKHANSHRQNYGAHTAAARPHSLETREAHRANHHHA